MDDYKLTKFLLTLLAGISVELFREIQNGTAKIVIEKGYLSFTRKSRNFPVAFKIRIPDEAQITDWLRAGLSFQQDGLPDE